MTAIRTRILLYSPGDGRRAEVEALVDTGAIFSVLPRRFLESLGVPVEGRRTFRTIDGRPFERDLGAVRLEVIGKRSLVPVPVIFGEERDGVVLGVTALEMLGLEVDPTRGELRETEFLMY